MEAYIQGKRRAMGVIVAILVGLGAWQYEFIWHGIEHNLFVNLAIIATMVTGIIIAFVKVSRLDNEVHAFHALQELWNDVQVSAKERDNADPFHRYYRCLNDGIVFSRPVILGHVYDLVIETVMRTRDFQINYETMNTLVHRIEEKLGEEKALLNYLAGLLVFMGLVGTFMGLLKMVGSIGGILGGIQATGDGGPDGFNRLLSDLQEPLGGMASGFASSLFGLCGSLVVGLLSRLTNDAASSLKHEFEAWLASVSQIHSEEDEDRHGSSLDAEVIKMLGVIVADYGRASRAFESTLSLLTKAADDRASQQTTLEKIAESLNGIAADQKAFLNKVGRLDALAPRLVDAGGRIEQLLAESTRSTEQQLATLNASVGDLNREQSRSLTNLAGSQRELYEAVRTKLADVGHVDTETLSSAVRTGLAPLFEKSLESWISAARTFEEEIRAANAESHRETLQALESSSHEVAQEVRVGAQTTSRSVHDAIAARLSPELAEIASLLRNREPSRDMTEVLVKILAEFKNQVPAKGDFERDLARIETTVANSLTRISDSTETVFSAYAGLLKDLVQRKAATGEPAQTTPADDVHPKPVEPAVTSREFNNAVKQRLSKHQA